MAISTYQVFLMVKGVSDYDKLIDIKDFPDLGGAPETLDTTTLSDNMTTSIPGIQSLEALTFNANYEKSEYSKLKEQESTDLNAEGGTDYAVWFGADAEGKPDGHNGKFSFKGKMVAHTTGGGVNEVVGVAITIAPSTPITFE
jgi:hypothetical protein